MSPSKALKSEIGKRANSAQLQGDVLLTFVVFECGRV